MEKLQVYSKSSPEMVSSSGISDVEGKEGGGEEEEGGEEEGGEAVDVMMDRRDMVDGGTTDEGVA